MRDTFLKLYIKGQALYVGLKEEDGQDLVEYAAIITLIVLALIAGMRTLATGINNAMIGVSGAINNDIG